MLSKILLSTATLFCIGVTAATAPFFLEEPNAAARSNEGVSAGIPFQKGEVTSLSGLSLTSPSGEVPAQFDGLARYEDGSYKWVLASFLSSIGLNAKQAYTVDTRSPSASPTTPITQTRSGSSVILDNGVLRLVIDTVNFTGLDSIYYRGTPVVGGKTGGLILDSYTDNRLYSNGTVTKAGAVYSGPLRVTYRVQGHFMKPSCGGVGYSFIVTLFAGSDRLKLDVSLRNSINETCGNYHQVRRCYVKLPLAFTPSAESQYLPVTDSTGLAKPGVKCLSNGSLALTVQEAWGGGYYYGAGPLGANARPTGYFQYHNIERTGGDLFVDVITYQDSSKPHNGWTRGYEDGPGYWMIDGQHKNSDIYLSFGGAAKSPAELAAEYTLNLSRLLGRPDPAYLSSIGAYGIMNRFGTLEDEKATWLKFGCDTTGGVYPAVTRSMDYVIYIVGSGSHYDSEEDPGEQNLIMWLRTGLRGYLDKGEGWTKYLMTNWTVHTDGWEYDGCDHLVQALRLKATRTVTKPATGVYNSNQNDATHDGPAGSGWSGCHFGGQGIIDWYCLTGEPEALDAAHDLGEYAWAQSWLHSDKLTPAKPLLPFTLSETVPGGGIKNVGREDTRPFKYLMSYVNQLRRPDPVWRDRMTYSAKTFLRAWNLDPRGYLFDANHWLTGWQASSIMDSTNFPPLLKDYLSRNNLTLTEIDARYNKILGSFEGHGDLVFSHPVYAQKVTGADTLRWFTRGDNTYWTYRLNQPMDLYYQMTGDEDARDFLIGYGQFLALSGLPMDTCGFAAYTVYDFPDLNKSLSGGYTAWKPDTHAVCWGPSRFSTAKGILPPHNSAYGNYYPSVMSLAYRYTGDRRILDKAFLTWNLNIKRDYKGTTTISYYPVAERIAKYAYINAAANTTGDRVTGGLALFYDAARRGADTAAPEAVTNLYARHADDKPAGNVYVTFTAPADRGGGEVAEYQVKYDTVPIVDYSDFDFSRDYILPAVGVRKSPWWYADNVQNEAPAQTPGSVVFCAVLSKMTLADTFYLAVRSRDKTGNLSPLSNILRLTPDMIASENGVAACDLFTLSCHPNPSNPATVLRYSLPSAAQSRILLYDARGRMVRDLSPTQARKAGTVVWNGRDALNRPVGSGIFFAKITSGGLEKKIRLVLVK